MTAASTARIIEVTEFVDGEYFAHVESALAKSTVDGYRKMWAAHREQFTGRDLEMRTCDAQSLMRTICTENPHLNKTTLRHLKNFYSGIWAHALRMGQCDRENPWRAVQIPQAPEPGETYAYSPADVTLMLAKLAEPYSLLVLLAACTGLRKSEIRGLRWSDFDPATSTLSVNRAVWRAHIKTTKSAASKAPVPVVPVLAAKLDQYKSHVPHGDKCFMFPNGSGGPLDLDNVARRFIAPQVGGIWRGWHAFRRGLATFLHAQNVADKEIQAILRHENVAITQKSYIKTVPENVRAAMATITFGEVV